MAGHPRYLVLANNRVAPFTDLSDAIDYKSRHGGTVYEPLASTDAACVAVNAELLEALKGLLGVIAADALIPESVSYMRQARAAVAAADALIADIARGEQL